MGLFDYFRHRRERESAIPSAQPETAPSAPQQEGANAVAMTPDLMQQDLMQQMMALQKLMTEHEVNLTQQPMEVREAVASDLQSRGINAQVGGALQITDPRQIQSVVEVLKSHGLLPANVTVN
jgi:hypothetical protein